MATMERGLGDAQANVVLYDDAHGVGLADRRGEGLATLEYGEGEEFGHMGLVDGDEQRPAIA